MNAWRNEWNVFEEIKQTIDDEPGPAGDFMKCFVTTGKEKQFFFNRAYCQVRSEKESSSWKCLLQ